jgi:hypothetical protein
VFLWVEMVYIIPPSFELLPMVFPLRDFAIVGSEVGKENTQFVQIREGVECLPELLQWELRALEKLVYRKDLFKARQFFDIIIPKNHYIRRKLDILEILTKILTYNT